jgi:hypothetical protein
VVLEKEEGVGMRFRWIPSALVSLLLVPAFCFADSSALIVQGPGGSDDYTAKFSKWAAGTQSVFVEDFGFAKDRVVLLAGDASRKANVEKAFEDFKKQVKPDDTFILILIGHGSFDTDYKLNIMGQDITSAEYAKLIDSLKPGRSIVVGGTTASGGLFETMSARNRVIVAASRSGEKEEGVFYEHFLAAMKGLAADENKDKKISVWEAFKYASAGVERVYKEQTRLQTEHPGLSANGAPQVAPNVSDQEAPVLARLTSLNADRPVTVSDPRLQALLDDKRAIEQRIETLRLDRNILPADEYEKRLEELILELARKNQQIQEQQKK